MTGVYTQFAIRNSMFNISTNNDYFGGLVKKPFVDKLVLLKGFSLGCIANYVLLTCLLYPVLHTQYLR